MLSLINFFQLRKFYLVKTLLIVFNSSHEKDNIEIERIVGYGNAGLSTRMLHGNVFNIIVRNLDKNTAEKVSNFCKKNRFIPFVNYYDSQRFGLPGSSFSTYLVGKAILEEKWEEAFSLFEKTNDRPIDHNFFIKCQNNKDKFLHFFKTINSKKVSFLIASYNSFLWNGQASAFIKRGKGARQYYFKNVGKLFLPVSLNFNISNLFSIDGYSFVEKRFSSVKEKFTRNIIITTTVFPLDISRDEFHKDKHQIKVSFFLPTGCYATMFIKQIFLRIYDK